MKRRKFLVNLTICAAALFCGLSLVGVYQFFVGNILNPKPETTEIKKPEQILFDINDPNSVLPINYEEEKLSDPKEDETNEKMFDPEGNYHILGDLPKGFEDFTNFTINNKNFDVDEEDENWGKLIAPTGFVDAKTESTELISISIGSGKLQFKTKSAKGISYEFRGEFLVKGNFYTLDSEDKVLKGILTKMQTGKKKVKAEVTFGWFLKTYCSC